MPRTGRPKVAPEEKKEDFITVRLTKGERKAIDETAQKDGKRATTWARDILLGNLAPKR